MLSERADPESQLCCPKKHERASDAIPSSLEPVAKKALVESPGAGVLTATPSLSATTFFRRELLPPAVELSSPEGAHLIREAMAARTAEGFLRLIEMLHTQQEPSYCGLATLVTVLNALSIDPERIYKGVWRFYSEDMLDCCKHLDDIKQTGLDFDDVVCLARCNGLSVRAKRAGDPDASIEAFRSAVKECSKVSDRFVVVSYTRKALNQTGDGHFSPLGAYHEASDSVLILDVARFKYRPHWISVEILWRAMKDLDPTTGLSRGYFVAVSAGSTMLPPGRLLALSPGMNFGELGDALVVVVPRAVRLAYDRSKTAEAAVRAAAEALDSTNLEKRFRGCYTKQKDGACINRNCCGPPSIESIPEAWTTFLCKTKVAGILSTSDALRIVSVATLDREFWLECGLTEALVDEEILDAGASEIPNDLLQELSWARDQTLKARRALKARWNIS